MSYRAFTDAICARLPFHTSYEDACRSVFDRWLADGRHEALIRYVVGEFDGAEGGEEYLRVLGGDLARIGRPDLIRKLYQPFIDRRRNHYFRVCAQLQSHRLVPKFVDRILNRISNHRRKLARYKLAILALMQEFRTFMAMTQETNFLDIDRQVVDFAAGNAPVRRPVSMAIQKMNERAFWTLIANSRAIRETDAEVVATIEASLVTLEPAEIERFQRILCKYLDGSYCWDLWAVAYAARGGCGDDEFDYFREWLILRGENTYKAATADPIAWALGFAFESDPQCEELLSAAPNAYRAKADREIPSGQRKSAKEPAGDAWEEKDFAIRFPALAARFGLS